MASRDIELKAVVEQEITTVDASGNEVTKLVTASKVIPGDVVIYTITARNVSQQPVERVVIRDPIPEHMTYVMGSAAGGESEIQFSVDGGTSFGDSESLVVRDAAGAERRADARDFTDIRWTLATAIPPSESRSVSFRARLD
jgi:uncharacterized repeat protein (TIGR01451 family)